MSLMRTLIRYVYLIKINFMYSVSFGDVLLLNIPPTQFKVLYKTDADLPRIFTWDPSLVFKCQY